MANRGYLTPESIPVEETCRALYIPNNQEIVAAVYGALLELSYPYNWELFGAITPEEIAYEMQTRVLAFMDSECMPQLDIFSDEPTQGTAGGGITANTNTEIFFQDAHPDNAGNVVLDAPDFIVSPGTYFVEMTHLLRASSASLQICWLKQTSNSNIIQEGMHFNPPTNVQGVLQLKTILVVAEETSYTFMARSTVSRASDAFGEPANVTGHVEHYGQVSFMRLQ